MEINRGRHKSWRAVYYQNAKEEHSVDMLGSNNNLEQLIKEVFIYLSRYEHHMQQ